MEKVVLPRISETQISYIITKWYKKIGESVEEGEVLAEIETDKATMEFESPFKGTLLSIIVPEGKEVEPGSIIAVIGDSSQKGHNITVKMSDIFVRKGINIVYEIVVQESRSVKKGDTVMLLRNENKTNLEKIVSPVNGQVNNIYVPKDAILREGDKLYSIRAEGTDNQRLHPSDSFVENKNLDSQSDSNRDISTENPTEEITDTALKILGGIGKIAALGAGLYFGGKALSSANKRLKERKQHRADVKREKAEIEKREKERKESLELREKERKKDLKKNIQSVKNSVVKKVNTEKQIVQRIKCPSCGGKGYYRPNPGVASQTYCRGCGGSGYLN